MLLRETAKNKKKNVTIILYDKRIFLSKHLVMLRQIFDFIKEDNNTKLINVTLSGVWSFVISLMGLMGLSNFSMQMTSAQMTCNGCNDINIT